MSIKSNNFCKDWVLYLTDRGDKPRHYKDIRTLKGNGHYQMSYNYKTLYSYNEKVAEYDNNVMVLHHRTKEWSHTSREHFYSVEKYTAQHKIPIVYIYTRDVEETLKWYYSNIEELFSKHIIARTVDYLTPASHEINRLQEYVKYEGIPNTKAKYLKDKLEEYLFYEQQK